MALVAVVGNRDRLRSTARRLISDLAAGAEGLEGMTRQELEHHVGSLRVTLGLVGVTGPRHQVQLGARDPPTYAASSSRS